MLHFYQCVRALIRGMVALLLSVDEEVDATRRDQSRTDGVLLLEHALEYTHVSQGHIIATCGLSGAGKSTFARKLAERIDAVHIRSDAVRKHLAGVNLAEHGKAIYSESHTLATYERLIELGILLAESGFSVILDAKFDLRETRATLIEKSEALSLPLRFVHCHAPADVLKKRLSQRDGDISDATEHLVDSQAKQYQSFDEEEVHITISLDTQDGCAVEAVLSELGAA